MKSKRHGNTDHSVAMGALRRELKAFIQSHPRSSRALLVEHGKKLLRDGLFEKHEDDYLGYIATNAVSMAEGDYAAATGRSAVTGLPASEPPKTTRSAGMGMSMGLSMAPAAAAPAPAPKPIPAAQREAEKAVARKAAEERLIELAPVILMKLPTPFGKPLGELTGKQGRKLRGWMGAAFKGVGDRQRLTDVKSEGQLRELWHGAR